MSQTEQKVHEAWLLREDGKPLDSIAILTELFNNDLSSRNWVSAIDIGFDLFISWKNLGKDSNNPQLFKTAYSYLERIKNISDINGLPLRNDWYYYMGNVLINLEDYQKAIENYEHFVKIVKPNPEILADTNANIGYAKWNIGQKEEGIILIQGAIETLTKSEDQHSHQGKDVTAIWKTGAKMLLAQVTENKTEAIKIIEEVITEAKEKGLGARLKQAETLLKSIA